MDWTDRYDPYTEGYNDGLAAYEPIPLAWFTDAQCAEYDRGYHDGVFEPRVGEAR